MNVYVGKWNLLPPEWEGINGLYEKSEDEIRDEIHRQANTVKYESYIGIYSIAEFEEEFNADNERELNGRTYFIKIFQDGKSVLNL